MTDDPVVLLREAADKERLELLDILASGDGQDWPDFWENAGQRQIAEQMYGAMVDELLASSWFAEVVRLRAQVEAVRELHRPITEVTSVPGYRDPETTWTRCGSNNCNPLVWPCDTVRALGGSNPVADAIDARIRNGSTGERRDLLAGYVEQEPDDD